MNPIIYSLRFRGHASPVSEGVLRAVTTAPSVALVTTVGDDGVESRFEPVPGKEATFESEVSFTDAAMFLEEGTITFSGGHRLHFRTIGGGHLRSYDGAAVQHGCVMWEVVGGEGQFEGAEGLITSNFFVGEGGEVTDHQFGAIFVAGT